MAKTRNVSHFKQVMDRKVQDPDIPVLICEEEDEHGLSVNAQHDAVTPDIIQERPVPPDVVKDRPTPISRTGRAKRLPSKYKDFILE